MSISEEVETFQLIYNNRNLFLEPTGCDINLLTLIKEVYSISLTDGYRTSGDIIYIRGNSFENSAILLYRNKNYLSELRLIIEFFRECSVAFSFRNRKCRFFENFFLDKIFHERLIDLRHYVFKNGAREVLVHFKEESVELIFEDQVYSYEYETLIFNTHIFSEKINLILS